MRQHVKFKVLRIRDDNDLDTDIGIVDVTTDSVHKASDFEIGKTYECYVSPYLVISSGAITEVTK